MISPKEELKRIAVILGKPVFFVGGFVRDEIMGRESHDVDIAADVAPDEVEQKLSSFGYKVKQTNKRLLTLRIVGEHEYEYTAFRTDSYDKGHSPEVVNRTSDIEADALRRDFTMNAVYSDVTTGEYIDPLGGIADIKAGRVRMTRRSVFEEDGLRLMRLCRQGAETGFFIEEETFVEAKKNAFRIAEISPERIRDELDRILTADLRYGVVGAHSRGIMLAEQTGVLEKILPEVVVGKGMAQRGDYHRYDVYGHTVATVEAAAPSVRLAALMHDIGKPYCKRTTGSFTGHAEEGAKMAARALERLRYPKKVVEEVVALTRYHMFDLKCNEPEREVRLFLQRNIELVDKLLLLKQADYDGGGRLEGVCPAVKRHADLLAKMKEEGVPFSSSELKLDGSDLAELGIEGRRCGDIIKLLLRRCALDGRKNERNALIEMVKKEIDNAD